MPLFYFKALRSVADMDDKGTHQPRLEVYTHGWVYGLEEGKVLGNIS